MLPLPLPSLLCAVFLSMGNAIYWHTCVIGSIKTTLNGRCVLSSHIVRRLNNKYKAKTKTPATNARQCRIRTTNGTKEDENEEKKKSSRGEDEAKVKSRSARNTPHTHPPLRIVYIKLCEALVAIVFYFRMNISWMVNCRDRKICFPFSCRSSIVAPPNPFFTSFEADRLNSMQCEPKANSEKSSTHTYRWGCILGTRSKFYRRTEPNTSIIRPQFGSRTGHTCACTHT